MSFVNQEGTLRIRNTGTSYLATFSSYVDYGGGPLEPRNFENTSELKTFLKDLNVADDLIQGHLNELSTKGETSITHMVLSDAELKKWGLA